MWKKPSGYHQMMILFSRAFSLLNQLHRWKPGHVIFCAGHACYIFRQWIRLQCTYSTHAHKQVNGGMASVADLICLILSKISIMITRRYAVVEKADRKLPCALRGNSSRVLILWRVFCHRNLLVNSWKVTLHIIRLFHNILSFSFFKCKRCCYSMCKCSSFFLILIS